MAGCFKEHKKDEGKIRACMMSGTPFALFYVGEGYMNWILSEGLAKRRGYVELSGKAEPNYYPTFDKPIDKDDPENTFKKNCAGIILEYAQKIHDKKNLGELKRYSTHAKRFMRKAEELFEMNGLP
jgi:hypothetical protein